MIEFAVIYLSGCVLSTFLTLYLIARFNKMMRYSEELTIVFMLIMMSWVTVIGLLFYYIIQKR